MNVLSGQGLLQLEGRYIACECELIEGEGLVREVSFRCRLPSSELPKSLQHATAVRLEADFLNLEVDCFLLSFPIFLIPTQEDGSVQITLRSSRTPILQYTGEPLVAIGAHLINFGGYLLKCPLLLHGGGWEVDLAPVSSQGSEDEQPLEYSISHAIMIKRESGCSFKAEEAHLLLDNLSTYLSFCHQRWVAPCGVQGFNSRGEVAMQEFGTRKVLSYQDASGWADRHHPWSIAEAFPGYLHLMNSPTNAEAIRDCIYWYLRADTNLVGPDGSIILLQAALERLAWHVLVETGPTSKTKFDELGSNGRFRELITQLSVSWQIPANLVELKSASVANAWSDAVAAWTKVRNELVHPQKKLTGARLPYYETYLLGKWWVELVLLRLFDFNGVYSNRTLKHRCVGQVEKVPWA